MPRRLSSACSTDLNPTEESHRIRLEERTDQVWHTYIPGLWPGQHYGYRVHGPYAPQEGHRFNHHKLLIDPYAKSIAGTIEWSDAMFGYQMGNPKADLSFDTRNNASNIPKCVVIDQAFTWGGDRSAENSMGQDRHLRSARQGIHGATPGRTGSYAGHLFRI